MTKQGHGGEYGFGVYLWLSGYGIGRREACERKSAELVTLRTQLAEAQTTIDKLRGENIKFRAERRVVGQFQQSILETRGGYPR
jgi:hypothetical protein